MILIHCLQGDIEVDKDIPWGPEFEHNVEFEFTPMDPRDYPGKICLCQNLDWFLKKEGGGGTYSKSKR